MISWIISVCVYFLLCQHKIKMVTKRKNLWKTRIHVLSGSGIPASVIQFLILIKFITYIWPTDGSLSRAQIHILWSWSCGICTTIILSWKSLKNQDSIYRISFIWEQKEGLQNLDNSDLDQKFWNTGPWLLIALANQIFGSFCIRLDLDLFVLLQGKLFPLSIRPQKTGQQESFGTWIQKYNIHPPTTQFSNFTCTKHKLRHIINWMLFSILLWHSSLFKGTKQAWTIL